MQIFPKNSVKQKNTATININSFLYFKKITLLLSLFMIIPFFNAKGQIAMRKTPPTFSIKDKRRLQIPTVSMPFVNTDSLRLLHSDRKKDNTFAYVFDVNISIKEKGYKFETENGKLWLLKIKSEGALSLNLTFSKYKLAKGCELYIYSSNKDDLKGAFTSVNNKKSNILSIEPIKGDEIIIEYFEPKDKAGELIVGNIGHDFLGIIPSLKGKHRGISGECNVDVNCMEGKGWENEKRSVCKIIVNNGQVCSGVLVNNTQNDGKPYFLTARHCINNEENAEKTLFIFNYESIFCEDKASEFVSLSGSSLLANSLVLDFSLVELSQEPPSDYGVYYSGWDLNPESQQSTVCIHHPSGDTKKISKNKNKLKTGNYGEGLKPFAHWLVERWDIGVTEKGSSGAPLFNKEHKLIGILSGGDAYCQNPVNDFFVKFHYLWDNIPEENRQLKKWLDPKNKGNSVISGYDPNNLVLKNNAQLKKIISPASDLCNKKTLKPKVIIQNKGINDIVGLNINCKINSEKVIVTKWNKRLLANAVDTVLLNEINLPTGKIRLTIYTSMPNNKEDTDKNNDTLEISFNNKEGAPHLINIKTDNKGKEISWQIRNNNNEIIYSGGNYESNKSYSQNVCLDYECFYFDIFDTGDNGICCENGKGEYSLIRMPEKETIFKGGEFDYRKEILLCVEDKIKFKETGGKKYFSVFPNPTTEGINIIMKEKNGHLFRFTDIPIKTELFDLSGKKINTYKWQDERMYIDMKNLAIGCYILKIRSEKETAEFSVIKIPDK